MRRIALFGTRYVVESRLFGMLDGIDVVVPEQTSAIHDLYMQIVEGAGEQARDALTLIAKQLPVDAIVLAGTDLSIIFEESRAGFPCVDSSRVHIQAMLREQNRNV
jgi:aspartate racemase